MGIQWVSVRDLIGFSSKTSKPRMMTTFLACLEIEYPKNCQRSSFSENFPHEIAGVSPRCQGSVRVVTSKI
jgi:hypothetical protein